jgi:hypothetical protein
MGKFADLHEGLQTEPDQHGFVHTATAQRRGGAQHEAKVKPTGDKYRVTHYVDGKYTGKENDYHFDSEHEAKAHANQHVQRQVAK